MAPSMRYLIVRTLLFVVPFIVLMVAGVPWLLSLIVSLAFAFAASIVFFSALRNEAAADLQRMREGRRRAGSAPDDAHVEDAVLGETHAEATDAGAERDAADPRDDPDASAHR